MNNQAWTKSKTSESSLESIRKELEKLQFTTNEIQRVLDLIQEIQKSHPDTLSQHHERKDPINRTNRLASLKLSPSYNRESLSSIIGANRGSDEKKQELFRELLETEKEYVESLKQIVDVWLIPLREAAESKTERILEKEDILKIFSNSEILYHVHKELCIEIQTCADLTSVVKIFNKRVPFMTIYTQYGFLKKMMKCFENLINFLLFLVNNWVIANLSLEKVKALKSFQTFCETKQTTASDLLNLLSKLLKRLEYYINYFKV